MNLSSLWQIPYYSVLNLTYQAFNRHSVPDYLGLKLRFLVVRDRLNNIPSSKHMNYTCDGDFTHIIRSVRQVSQSWNKEIAVRPVMDQPFQRLQCRRRIDNNVRKLSEGVQSPFAAQMPGYGWESRGGFLVGWWE